MKPLKPTMRENKRYMRLRGKSLKSEVQKAILEFIGVLGMSKVGFSFVKSSASGESAIISVNRESVDSVRASLVVWPNKITVEKVSGTLKGLGKK
jgi:RNase P/RNase MRP subunit POP5